MGDVFLLALLAALNPTLFLATTVMLLLPRPWRLLLGYWLGAMVISVTLGLTIIYAIGDSDVVSTTKNTLSPIANFVLAAILLVLAVGLGTGRDKSVEEKRKGRKAKREKPKEQPKWQQQLSKGTARTTFVVGALLSLPGATYIAGLNDIRKLHYSTAGTVILVIGFNLIQLVFLEVPLVGLKVAPTWTPNAIESAKEWAGIHGREYAAWGLAAVGVALAIKGVIEIT
jgi:hypothetical protein